MTANAIVVEHDSAVVAETSTATAARRMVPPILWPDLFGFPGELSHQRCRTRAKGGVSLQETLCKRKRFLLWSLIYILISSATSVTAFLSLADKSPEKVAGQMFENQSGDTRYRLQAKLVAVAFSICYATCRCPVRDLHSKCDYQDADDPYQLLETIQSDARAECVSDYRSARACITNRTYRRRHRGGWRYALYRTKGCATGISAAVVKARSMWHANRDTGGDRETVILMRSSNKRSSTSRRWPVHPLHRGHEIRPARAAQVLSILIAGCWRGGTAFTTGAEVRQEDQLYRFLIKKMSIRKMEEIRRSQRRNPDALTREELLNRKAVIAGRRHRHDRLPHGP